MKNLTMLFTAIILLGSVATAQMSKKELKKELNAKASKQARQDAKKFRKEGWDVAPGSLPLEMMLQSTYEKKVDKDEKGNPLYLFADGDQVGQSRSAAEMGAMELAKISLAGLIESNINSLVTANIANSSLTREEAVSVGSVIQSSKNIISTQLGYIDPVVKMYRNVGTQNTAVHVTVAYDRRQSMEIAKKVVRKELTDKLKLNEETLEKLMGINK